MLSISADYWQQILAGGIDTIKQTFSDGYLLDFLEKEISGYAKHADEVISVLNSDQVLWSESAQHISQRMTPILNMPADRKAALKIACYVAGTIQEQLAPSLRTKVPADYFAKAAELGYEPALAPLATCYLRGERLTCNQEASYLAKEILWDLSEKKHPQASYQLAKLHNELGDHDSAYDFLTIAQAHNCPEATVEIGEIHFYGNDDYRFTKNKEYGESLLQIAATELGSSRAKKILGDIYSKGEGQHGAVYFSKGQENNDPDAIFELSKLYEQGTGGVAPDMKKAHELLLSASASGSAKASIKLAGATLKKHGDTLLKFPEKENFDQHEAYPHLLKAADQHDKDAAFAVGTSHLLRVWRNDSSIENKPTSLTIAEKYLKIAEEMGHKKASYALRNLNMLRKQG